MKTHFLSSSLALTTFFAAKLVRANVAIDQNLYSNLGGGMDLALGKAGVCNNKGTPWSEMQCVEIPKIVFTYKGIEYSLSEGSLNVIVEKDNNLPKESDAQYVRIRAFKKGMPRISLKYNFVDKFDYYTSWGPPSSDIRGTVKHEVIHFLVDAKYFGDGSSPEYHFVSEMMAYMGGNGFSEDYAAKHIAKHYPDLKEIAEEFIDSKNKAKSINHKNVAKLDSQVDLHTLDLDNPNGDWCKCAKPGCVANITEKGWYVTCQCNKCMKINVEYARKALDLEAKSQANGGKVQWYGDRNEAVKAAGANR